MNTLRLTHYCVLYIMVDLCHLNYSINPSMWRYLVSGTFVLVIWLKHDLIILH